MRKRAPIPTNWKERLKAELARDKKKTGVLAVMLLVAGILGGRLAITHSVPDAAAAPPTPAAAELLSGGAAADWRARPRTIDRAIWAEYVAKMDRTIDRDLFTPNLECFPLQPGARPAGADAGEETVGWFGWVRQQVRRKQRDSSDELTRIRAVRAQAEKLSLQSTMLGKRPTAMINGQVLYRQDEVGGFLVKRIDSNSCVVSKDGVDVELRMD